MPDKSVIFIEPKGSDSNVFDNYMNLPLLGSLYLGTILHNHGYKVKIISENILGRRILPVELRGADYVCLSSLTLNANQTKTLAGRIRQVSPGTKIFIGGIHASLIPDEFLPFADHVVVGEAEGIILDLMEGKYSEKIVHGSRFENLDELPMINYSLLENLEAMDIIPIMTSRGCPFNCNFCTVTQVFGKLYRKQSPARIIAEIKNAMSFFRTRDFFFYDDNLTADRKRIVELTDLMISEKLDILWTAQVRVDIARDEELLDKMYLAGCERFYIGFESINDEVLKAYKKGQTRADIEKAIQTIQHYGINIHGMFMFGADNDRLENLEATADFAMNFDLDTVQFMILTPFPETQIYKDLDSEGRIIHRDWEYYNGMFVLFRPRNFSAVELQEAASRAYKKFYSLNRTLLDILHFGFNALFDALIWDFSNAKRYNHRNFVIKMAAKMIIHDFEKSNRTYIEAMGEKAWHSLSK